MFERDKDEVLGSVHLKTYRGSVIALMGNDAPPVYSAGARFYHSDRWSIRLLVQWIAKNVPSDRVPTDQDLANGVKAVNGMRVSRYIVIAETPDKMTESQALALTGGAYHEALHGLLSCRRDLTVEEVVSLLTPEMRSEMRAAMIPALMTFENVIEDVRIEGVGASRFPGIRSRLEYVAEMVLRQEAASKALEYVTEMAARQEAESKVPATASAAPPKDPAQDALWAVILFIRDLGHGYPCADAALEARKEAHPDIWALLEGPLAPLMAETISLREEETNDLSALALAFKWLAELSKLGRKPEDFSPEASAGDDPACPKCGNEELILEIDSPLSTEGVLRCPKCGWSAPVKVDHKPGSGKGGRKLQVKIKNNVPMPGDAKEPGPEPSDAKKPGPESSGSKDTPEEGEGSHTKPKQKDVQGGGRNTQRTATLAEELEKGLQIPDVNTVLGGLMEEARARDPLRPEEQRSNPLRPDLDEIRTAPASRDVPAAKEAALARKLEESVKKETAYLRARLRTLWTSLVPRGRYDGARQGADLSEVFLTETRVACMARETPDHAFVRRGERQDLSMAVAIVLDESGSMGSQLAENTQILMILTEPLSTLGAAVMACGFTDQWGREPDNVPATARKASTRTNPVQIDIFKRFHEPYNLIRGRMTRTRAAGSTPMAAGIEYAWRSLQGRPETHKFLFVVTDGCPNGGEDGLIRWASRKCREDHITVVGVGCGSGASSVKELFQDHIFSDSVQKIPGLLMNRMTAWVRGRR